MRRPLPPPIAAFHSSHTRVVTRAPPKKSLTGPLFHQSTHHATLEALLPVSVLSLAAFYLSRMGSSRPIDRFRSASAQLQAIKQGPRQPQCRQRMTAACVRASRHASDLCNVASCFIAAAKAQCSRQIDWQLSCRRQFGASSCSCQMTPVQRGAWRRDGCLFALKFSSRGGRGTSLATIIS